MPRRSQSDSNDPLRVFRFHGVEFTGSAGSQQFGTCPVCGKENKFYVNKDNGLWDCKFCEEHGNAVSFLRFMWSKLYRESLGTTQVKWLAKDRGLPISAFGDEQDLGWNPNRDNAMVGIYNDEGKIQDIRAYNKRMYSSPGSKLNLVGLTGLIKKGQTETPIFLCEGEWDRYALRWLLRLLKKPGIVVAVPGAGVFKQEWAEHFRDRTVYACYDNDPAGAAGDARCHQMLKGIARKVYHLHWTTACPDGWDIRDWIRYGCFTARKPKACYSVLMKCFKDESRNQNPGDGEIIEVDDYVPPPPKTLVDVKTCIDKWLMLPDFTPVEVALAVCISQKIPGDPLWMFMVAPPGSAKTEVLRSLEGAPSIVYREGLTPRSLISGMPKRGKYDPSLLSMLDQKILVVKDFTGIIGMKENDREEIFSTLRMAYDGKVSKQFGTGEREYKAHFTILAAVTNVIYGTMAAHAALGERFLNFVMMDDPSEELEVAVCNRVLEMAGREVEMRKEMNLTLRGFYENLKIPKKIPEPDGPVKDCIRDLGRLLAHCRGTVTRDHYRPDLVATRPSREMPTRCVKQLKRLVSSVSIIRGKTRVTMAEYEIARRCAIDSISQRRFDVLRSIYNLTKDSEHDSASFKVIAVDTKYPTATVIRVCQDLLILGILERPGDRRGEFQLTERFRKMATGSRVFENGSTVKLRIRRRAA